MPAQPSGVPYGNAPPSGQTNAQAVAALVLGIIGLLLAFLCWPLGILLCIAAIVFGFLGRSKAATMAGSGGGMALAGIITGGLGILLSIVFSIIFFVAVDTVTDDLEVDSDPSDGECDLDRFIQDPDC